MEAAETPRRPIPTAVKAIGAVIAIVVAGAGALAIATALGDETEPLLASAPSPAKQVASVRLTDVTESDDGPATGVVPTGDGLKLVYFGFTSCPDICPTTLADLSAAIGRLPAKDRERVTVAFISVDPKRDSGATLRSYLSHFFEGNPSQALRTDDPESLADAEGAFGASHKLGKSKPDGSYDVSHTAFTYAVGSDGEVIVEWPFGVTADGFQHDLKILLDD